ncbi:hypothetical protein ABEW00_02835 [Rossellomorea vietnamensis]|uniref:hypothetical protein n=1 Tax=Rossellomorea vietnamensis TaxID=218284 RepID=UPI003D2AC874
MKTISKINLLSLSVLVFFSLQGCDPFANEMKDFYQSTESIDLSNENIKLISTNSIENDVISVFGEPNDVEEITSPKSKYITYEGIEFGFIEDKVIRYIITDKYETAYNIKIGDLKEKVFKEYGGKYYKRVESGLETVGYFDKNNLINIEFGFKENKVIAIIVQKINWRENR